jgi:hypothetical protein
VCRFLTLKELFHELDSCIHFFVILVAQSSNNSNRKTFGSNEDTESLCGRLVGRVRRHMPYDTRDPIGAIIRFYVGNPSDSSW